MLAGVSRMLRDVITLTIADEPDMVIVENAAGPSEDFGSYARRKKIDVVIFSKAPEFSEEGRIDDLLRVIPRIGLLEVVGAEDRGTLHHLVAAHDEVGPLTQSNLVAGIRAGAALRRR
jgi:hypothetical protein